MLIQFVFGFLHFKPGMVEGKVLEILTSDSKVGGKSVRASEDSPQLRLESVKSGKEVRNFTFA